MTGRFRIQLNPCASYEMELQGGGATRTERGMATEIFVRKEGDWLNTGWQLAPP